MMPAQRPVYDLFVLNIALQLFDAVATYQGVRIGCVEANPIIATAFGYFGIVPTLLLFKAKACGLLFLLNRNYTHRVVAPTLYTLATVYCVLSLVPWLTKFAMVLIETV